MMQYETFRPHPDLEALVKCYWTLEIPAQPAPARQRIVPDGCIEMIFILGSDVKRYTTGDAFILQPRAMILGQITGPFFVEPTGDVSSFAVRFYPHGFACFASIAIHKLANMETPIAALFGEHDARLLARDVAHAADTAARVAVVEAFLLRRLTATLTVDSIVQTTVDALLQSRGSQAIHTLAQNDNAMRRQLERKFRRHVGLSPKQLGRVIRLQAALKMMLSEPGETLTAVAYESNYYDQAHFIRDFREFTGTSPKDFSANGQLQLSTLFYGRD